MAAASSLGLALGRATGRDEERFVGVAMAEEARGRMRNGRSGGGAREPPCRTIQGGSGGSSHPVPRNR
jgi:hypothetical protein